MYYISVRTPSASLPLCTFISDTDILTLRKGGVPGLRRRGGYWWCVLGEWGLCPIIFSRWGDWCKGVTTESYKPPRSLFLTRSHRPTSVWDRTALFLSSHWNHPHPISKCWPYPRLSKHTLTSLFTLPWLSAGYWSPTGNVGLGRNGVATPWHCRGWQREETEEGGCN